VHRGRVSAEAIKGEVGDLPARGIRSTGSSGGGFGYGQVLV
jgi:hypothetical protein